MTNLILNGIKTATLTEAQKLLFGTLAQPRFPGWLTSVSVQADKDATIIFGCYDGTVFYPAYPVTLLAAGSSEHSHTLNTGMPLPLGGNVRPAIKVIVGTTVILTGHVEIAPSPADRDNTPFTPAPFDPILD